VNRQYITAYNGTYHSIYAMNISNSLLENQHSTKYHRVILNVKLKIMKIKKIILAVFFFAWERYIYSELTYLVEKTDTLIDDVALSAVDSALEQIKEQIEEL
jgi:hypothetical protein